MSDCLPIYKLGIITSLETNSHAYCHFNRYGLQKYTIALLNDECSAFCITFLRKAALDNNQELVNSQREACHMC